MTDKILKADICIIGGGSGGLSVAAGAAQLGASVVLFERAEMGGDCLNTGCVPSKAMLEAAKIAKIANNGMPSMGISAGQAEIDFGAVKAHVRDVIAGIAPHDSEERFRGLGVNVIKSEASFTSKDSVTAIQDGEPISVRAKYFVVATGSHPVAPPINGLEGVSYYTNETIFDLNEKPQHLIIIGGGPIGIEMAQAHRRLGCDVTVLEASAIMGRDDPDLVGRLMTKMTDEGIRLIEQARITSITQNGARIMIDISDGESIEGTHLLVAAGRRPNIDTLNLEAASISYDARGIQTDNRLRSSNKRVYAIGDVAGRHQFTHVAGYHAGIVIRNILFKLPAKLRDDAIPWVTYTDPELAQTGLTWTEAVSRYGADAVRRTDWELRDNDRARAARRTEGLIRVISDKKGKILGASILAPNAGELIHSWTLALQAGLKMSAMAGTIAPYPSWSEASKRAAGAFFTERLFSARTKKLVQFLLKLW
ncbi:MAG: FAD-dependent oxidoreductase [Alphaproteobacteria bacterium]|nr:FAD-dependent oxidoreductase [Alphaproteobacteria bacterium]